MSKRSRLPLYRTQLLIVVSICIFSLIVAALAPLISKQYEHAIILASLLFIALSISFLSWSAMKVERLVRYMHGALRFANKGQLNRRITDTPNLGEIGFVAWELNDFLDQVETYFNEVNACMKRVETNDFDRLPIKENLYGQFAQSLDFFEHAIDVMRQGKKLQNSIALNSKLAELNVTNLINNLNLNQSDLITMSAQIDGVTELARNNRSRSQDANQNIKAMSSDIESIDNAMGKIVSVNETLSQQAKEIESSLTLINQITEQTTLLALNASIEAARAGEHGRGFAVVADEVKHLSQQTQKIAEEIFRKINGFTSAMKQTLDSSLHASEQAKRTNEKLVDVVQGVNTITDSADKIADVLVGVNRDSFLTLIKLDHIIYKQNAYFAINNESDQARQEVNLTHTECRMGRWYDSNDAKAGYSANHAFAQIEEPHRIIHEEVHKALSAHGSQSRPDIVVQHMSNAESASDQVFDLVNQLKHSSESDSDADLF